MQDITDCEYSNKIKTSPITGVWVPLNTKDEFNRLLENEYDNGTHFYQESVKHFLNIKNEYFKELELISEELDNINSIGNDLKGNLDTFIANIKNYFG